MHQRRETEGLRCQVDKNVTSAFGRWEQVLTVFIVFVCSSVPRNKIAVLEDCVLGKILTTAF